MQYMYLLLLIFPFLFGGSSDSGTEKINSVATAGFTKLGESEATISNTSESQSNAAISSSELQSNAAISSSESQSNAAISSSESQSNAAMFYTQSSSYGLIIYGISPENLVEVPEPTPGGLTMVGSGVVMLLILRRRSSV